jgi:hypothetical protein
MEVDCSSEKLLTAFRTIDKEYMEQIPYWELNICSTSQNTYSQHFMETEDALSCLLELTSSPCHKPAKYNAHPPICYFKICIWEQSAEKDIWTEDGWNGIKFKNAG